MHRLLQECVLVGFELILDRKSLNTFTQVDHEIKQLVCDVICVRV